MGTMWRREKNKKHSIVKKKKSMNNVTLLLITCTKFYHVKEDYFHHHVFNLTEPTFPIPSLCNTCPSFSNTFLKRFQYVFLLPMCLGNRNVKHLLWHAFCNFHLLLQTFCFSLPSDIPSAIFFTIFTFSHFSLPNCYLPLLCSFFSFFLVK